MGNKLHQLLLEELPRISTNLAISKFIKKQVKSIVDCRTMNLGGHIYFCPDSHGGLVFYNSCKKRGCPVCMETEQLKWFSNKRTLLLPVKHHHLVFKFPSELAHLWLYNKQSIQKIMFSAAKDSINKMNRKSSLNYGWISALHTWGGDLSYHPHLHTLITDGAFDKNWNWQDRCLVVKNIKTNYDKIIRIKLVKALYKNQLQLPPGDEIENITKIINSKKFLIRQVGLYEDGKGVLKYLSNKLKTVALNHWQIISYDSETVTFYYERNGKKERVKLKREEFIRRFLNHLPPKGFIMVRSYGLYSTKHQTKTKELKIKLFGVIEEEAEYKPVIFTCPDCGKELSIKIKYSVKEFRKLYKQMRIGNPDRSPPGHKEFIKNKNNILTQS
jgi:hypothetical protein